jgi:hypothetical protein
LHFYFCKMKWHYVYLLLPAAAACAYASLTLELHTEYSNRLFSPWTRLCSQGKYAWLYAQMVLLPCRNVLTFAHDVAPTSNPWWLLAAVCGWLVALLRGNTGSWFVLCGSVALLLPEFTIMNLELIFEHRLYIPVAFLVCCMPQLPQVFVNRYRSYLYAVAILLVISNLQYQFLFASPTRLWDRVAEVYPKSFRAHLNCAKMSLYKEPAKALYHINALRYCERNRRLEKEIRKAYNTLYAPHINREIIGLNNWIR